MLGFNGCVFLALPQPRIQPQVHCSNVIDYLKLVEQKQASIPA